MLVSNSPRSVILSKVEGSFRLYITDAQKILRLASLAQNDTVVVGVRFAKRSFSGVARCAQRLGSLVMRELANC